MVTVTNLLLGPRLARAAKLTATPKVSILIPARNEAGTIQRCLSSMLAQNYSDFEIIVLNDQSTDQTEKVVQETMQHDSRIRLIQGTPLPAGWTGKNWACHQLSQAATGEIVIFTDADNLHAPFAISHTVAYMQKLGLGLLSAFPQQKTITPAEKMIVPIVDFFVYGTLPLWLTYHAPFPSLAAANGQWLAFTREGYARSGGHTAVKDQLVEDTELSRIAKRKGVKILTTAGTGTVFCRMYQSTREVWEGFSKNFYGLTGYHNSAFFSIIFMLLAAFVLPYFLIFFPGIRFYALIAVGLNMLLRALLALRYRHPFWVSTLLHPVSTLFAIAIGLNSFVSFKRGKINWKGREILIQKPGTNR